MYDTKEENGKIMSKVVFLNNDGLLSKEFKYEFTYNENGKVASKTAYRWDKSNDEWQPYYQSIFTYNEKGEIHEATPRPLNSGLDIKKAINELDYQPHTFEEGLEEMR